MENRILVAVARTYFVTSKLQAFNNKGNIPFKHRLQPQTPQIKAFAKISSNNGICYYVQTQSVTLGRLPQNQDILPQDKPDLDIGAVNTVSRKHALITFDQREKSIPPSNSSWIVICLGKNGMAVDGIPLKLGDERALCDGYGKFHPIM